MTPANIDRYRILAEIGRGGMAVVYLGVDTQYNQQVAIKVLPRRYMHQTQFRARFTREIQILTSLRKEGVVPIVGYGQYEGQPYLVMRYMAGGSLEEIIKRIGPISIQTTAEIVAGMASVLDHAHEKGIVHRDLKPSNILFDEQKIPYISDFGIARMAEHGGMSKLTGTMILGTPAYMSPEQARGGEEVDGRSDVYALGAIIFEMLTGKQPFAADTPMQVVMMHMAEPVPDILMFRSDLPRQCRKIIQKAMAKEPEKRYRTAGELARDLQKAARGSFQVPLPSFRLGAGPFRKILSPFGRLFSSRKTWLAIAGLLILLLVYALRDSPIFRIELPSLPTPTLSLPAAVSPTQLPASPTPEATATKIVIPTATSTGEAAAGLPAGQLVLPEQRAFLTGDLIGFTFRAFEMEIFHRNGIDPPGLVFAMSGSFLSVLMAEDQRFKISFSTGSRLLIDTGSYNSASMIPEGSGIDFTVSGSCAAFDHSREDEIRLSCFEGDCSYSLAGLEIGSVPSGSMMAFDIMALHAKNVEPIPARVVQDWQLVVPQAVAVDCLQAVVPTNTLRPFPTATPTATQKPRANPTKTSAPPPSNTNTPKPPTLTPTPTYSPLPPTPTVSPTRTPPPPTPTATPAPS